MVRARTGPSSLVLRLVGRTPPRYTSNDAFASLDSGVTNNHQFLSGCAPGLMQIARLDPFNACLGHVRPRLRERTLQIDRAAGILDHVGLEALAPRVERAPGHAEIGREPAEENGADAAPAQIPG